MLLPDRVAITIPTSRSIARCCERFENTLIVTSGTAGDYICNTAGWIAGITRSIGIALSGQSRWRRLMHWDMPGVLSAVVIESIWTPRSTRAHVVDLPSAGSLVEMGENSSSQIDSDRSAHRSKYLPNEKALSSGTERSSFFIVF